MPDPAIELQEHYLQWLRLAKEEHSNIRRCHFNQLEPLGQRKLELIDRIVLLEAESSNTTSSLSSLRPLLRQIADLEQLNLELITQRSRELQVQRDDLSRRQQQARRLRSKYASGPS